jgi:hypothetical protein
MAWNELGMIVNAEWKKTPSIREDMKIELGEFITMPNHFHGIIHIGLNKYNSNLIRIADHEIPDDGHTYEGRDAMPSRDAMHGVSTGHGGLYGYI